VVRSVTTKAFADEADRGVRAVRSVDGQAAAGGLTDDGAAAAEQVIQGCGLPRSTTSWTRAAATVGRSTPGHAAVMSRSCSPTRRPQRFTAAWPSSSRTVDGPATSIRMSVGRPRLRADLLDLSRGQLGDQEPLLARADRHVRDGLPHSEGNWLIEGDEGKVYLTCEDVIA
jgi:hypothetical protein